MIKVNDISFGYDNHLLIENASLDISEGDFIFLLGKSGSGKSSLMKLLYFDLFPSEGEIEFLEYSSENIRKKEITELRRKIGIVFQDFRLLPNRTVYGNLSFVLEVTGAKKKDIPEKINKVLKEVGLLHRAESLPNELSGGEQQRIAIARAIVNEPVIVLADEPTGNLDPQTSDEIFELFKKINSRGTAVFIATHNYSHLEKYSSRKMIIEDKKIKSFTPKQPIS